MGEPTKGQEMTTQHPEAPRLADELDAVPETGADPQTIQEAAAELRRQHARIAELEARIKTMAEEHADELMVAHLDGRMRAEQAIPGVQWQCGPQANGFTAPQADSQPAADEIISMAREQGLPETEIEGVFRVNVDDLGRMFAADRAARKQGGA
jgi:hypothetical protein